MCVLTKIIIIIMVKLPFGVVSSSLNSVSCHNESGLHLTLFDFDQWKPDLINGYCGDALVLSVFGIVVVNVFSQLIKIDWLAK